MAGSWQGCAYTNTGSVRALNEDSVLTKNDALLWAVADGMGGHQHGDFASQLVVQELAAYQPAILRGTSIKRLLRTLHNCNMQLVEKAANENAGIIGCTVATLSLHGGQAICSWSGDSRIYRVRSGEILQLTRDHSHQTLAEDRDLFACAVPARGDGQALTAAIGGAVDAIVEHCLFNTLSADRYLLCTDGLYKELTDTDILNAMLAEPSADSAVEEMTKLYFERGARDNVGLVVVQEIFT